MGIEDYLGHYPRMSDKGKFLVAGGLVEILKHWTSRSTPNTRVWLCRDGFGRISYTLVESIADKGTEKSGGVAIPLIEAVPDTGYPAVRLRQVQNDLRSFLCSLGLPDGEADDVIACFEAEAKGL
jgi:hypothetical protein